MDAVAVHALRGFRLARRQSPAMNAGPVESQLVCALLRLELAHEFGVAVAAPAVVGHLFALDPNLEAAIRIHGHVLVVFTGVATMTGGATDLIGAMHVILEDDTRAFHDAVAIKA